IESAWPRTIAASRLVILRAGSGSRALPGARPGRSAANVTSSSGAFAIARKQEVTARLNGSVGASFDPVRNLVLDVVIVTSPPSSPRTRGPIATGGRCFRQALAPSLDRHPSPYGSPLSRGRRRFGCSAQRHVH